MKKFLAILLAAVLCFALAACGGNGGQEEPEKLGMSESPIAEVALKCNVFPFYLFLASSGLGLFYFSKLCF